jgi:hypothetical protein
MRTVTVTVIAITAAIVITRVIMFASFLPEGDSPACSKQAGVDSGTPRHSRDPGTLVDV